MAWNLADPLTKPGQRRRFYLPLASTPPGRNAVRAVDYNLFDLEETFYQLSAADDRTSDIELRIKIRPPAGGFMDENSLPDPAIRLHAVGVAIVTFRPATPAQRDSLVLRIPTFAEPIHTPPGGGVKWWQRWIEAQSIPQTVIYENVDRVQLQEVLNAVDAPAFINFDEEMPSTFGLMFPNGVNQRLKADFITQFLAGTRDYFMVAEAGAYIGTTASDPNESANRLLKLHVQYHDHNIEVNPPNPHPMNPREFFYLLFGNDSQEAIGTTSDPPHPLLRKMNVYGLIGQGGRNPETRRMLLRPPLRTWKRVMWEGDQEITNHSANWAPAGALGGNRLYNNHSRGAHAFYNGTYDAADCPPVGCNKCNVFVSDIPLRAGFRVCIFDTGNSWHYIDANTYTNLAHPHVNFPPPAVAGQDRVPLQGVVEDAPVTWGWKIENWLRAQPAADRQQLLNEAMTEEGRCLILAGARARKFVPRQVVPGVQGVANCNASLRRTGIGHIVIVREISGQPLLAATVGEGLQSIPLSTIEASGAGAVNGTRDGTPGHPSIQLGGVAGAAAGAAGFIRLHLIELHPGKDPDTAQGLRDLNVRNRDNLNLIGLPNERAADVRITHTHQPGYYSRPLPTQVSAVTISTH